MSRVAFTADEILSQLDACAAEIAFPMLDNGYVYPGDVRLTAYRDDERWAVILEQFCFFYKLDAREGIANRLYQFGNCLSGQPGWQGSLSPLTEDAQRPAFAEWDEWLLPNAEVVLVRGQPVPIPRDPATFTAKGIVLANPPGLRAEELLRALLPEHRDQLLATEEELRRLVPADLPFLLRLDEWHHPDTAREERPSESPSFQSLADVLVMGEPNGYRPHPNPNTHWKNWPEGGRL